MSFDLPTEFELQELDIDGNDVLGLFASISVFENIYSPLITGHVTLLETDTPGSLRSIRLKATRSLSSTSRQPRTPTTLRDTNGLRTNE